MEQGVKDEAAREAGRNEKADLERDRKIIPPSLYPENLALYGKPSPGPVTSGTPSFGGAPGAMGSPTVKKKKLLGG
jgi:hypothetical protein